MTQSEFKLLVDEGLGSTSVIATRTAACSHLLILAHGAGADMRHSFMQGLSDALVQCGVATWRFNFLFKEVGKTMPDHKPVAVATIDAVVSQALRQCALPLSLGGKSFGGRMMSHFLAQHSDVQIAKMIYFGFPLHPAAKPGTERAVHLTDIIKPMYFLQGDRDALAKLDLLAPIVNNIANATLDILPGADHSFKFLKRHNINTESALSLLAQKAAAFIRL